MALSQAKNQRAPSVRSHDTVEAVVADEWASAASIRGEVHPAEEDVSEVDVEAAADADEMNERSVQIPISVRLNYIESFICNLEQLTEVPYPLRAVNIAQKKTHEESICVNRLETSYGVLKVTLCGDIDVSKDSFVF